MTSGGYGNGDYLAAATVILVVFGALIAIAYRFMVETGVVGVTCAVAAGLAIWGLARILRRIDEGP